MKIIAAGLGPGDVELISLRALHEAQLSDIIIVPRSQRNTPGLAERIIKHHLPGKKYIPLTFPMTIDEHNRDTVILSQIDAVLPELKKSEQIFFPVIGDAMLFSTAKYFLDALSQLLHEAHVDFIPGISAHSLAASCAKKFLAMRDEIFTIIPGTAEPAKIKSALRACNNAAIYKPVALHNISELVRGFNIIRVDYAGIPEQERIISGDEALCDIRDYLSIILLWRE